MLDKTSATTLHFGRTTLIARVGVLLLVSGLVACKGGKQDWQMGDMGKQGPTAVPVEVAKATPRPITASYNGTAALEAQAEAQVVSKTSGLALDVLAEIGQKVKAGQVLIHIDRDRAKLQLAQAEAQVRKLEANYSRSLQLAKQKMVSVNDVDQLRFDLDNTRAQLRMAKLELSYGSVVAPISGVVSSRDIKPGNFVQINTPIFTIVDTSRLEATLNVPEREIAKLKPGQPVLLTVDALPNKTFEGKIDRVSPVVDAGSGTFRVVAAFAGNDALKPGMFGRIQIRYDQHANALAIPRSALLEDGNEPAVFVVDGDKVKRVALTLGYTDGAWVEARRGLKEGDQVVVAGKAALREGGLVKVLDADADAAADSAGPVASGKTNKAMGQKAR